jgi:protein-S-isoprenylcysteine O-methyltransferase Ste14
MALYELLYRITSGPTNARRILTPLGLIAFFAFVGAIIGGGVLLDRWLGFGRLLPRLPGVTASIPLIAGGAFLSGWSILVFMRGRGTPVPFNPPPELITRGPYAYSRNPMLAGLILQFFGLGLLIGSVGLTLIATPALLAASVLALKVVEEPELERRLGAAYVEYRRATPMFLPRLDRTSRDARR